MSEESNDLDVSGCVFWAAITLGASIGVIGLAFNWSRARTDRLERDFDSRLDRIERHLGIAEQQEQGK